MKLFLYLSIVLLLAACGKKGHESPSWPARVSLAGMSPEEKTRVRQAVEKLNAGLGKEAVREDDSSLKYEISISVVSAPDGDIKKAGIAVLEDKKCTIHLSELLFTNAKKENYLTEVTWHEIGHCAGLNHEEQKGEMMSATTGSAAQMSSGAVQRFLKVFLQATRL